VVLERPDPRAHRPAPHRVRGVIFGGLGGMCQAVGLVLSKLGMGHDPRVEMPPVGPWSATLVRMAFAAVGVVVLAGAIRDRRGPLPPRIDVSPESEHLPPGSPASRQLPFALAMVMIGVTFGPVLGVWSSMVAVDHAEAGIAATLMAMTPVFILPFAIFIERERVSWRAALGAMVAVAGVGILAAVNGG
jgi:drug/metabolite transporter (DMT)-like permease